MDQYRDVDVPEVIGASAYPTVWAGTLKETRQMKQTIIAILISLVLSVACCAQDAGLLVYFEGSKLGDTYFAKRIAFVDDGQSRLPSRHTENIRQIADTVAPEVMIIAGHGPAANAGERERLRFAGR